VCRRHREHRLQFLEQQRRSWVAVNEGLGEEHRGGSRRARTDDDERQPVSKDEGARGLQSSPQERECNDDENQMLGEDDGRGGKLKGQPQAK